MGLCWHERSAYNPMTKSKRSLSTERRNHLGHSDQSIGPKEIAFSVRLTTEEHELLKQAAALRGWTPTNLIRTATLERAKHILNTSRVTTLNFKGLAVRIADKLFKQRRYEVSLWFGGDDGMTSTFTSTVQMTAAELAKPREEGEGSVGAVRPEDEEFPVEALSELKMAVRCGGGEFLNQILEYCEGLTAPRRSDVPSPIDPSAPGGSQGTLS